MDALLSCWPGRESVLGAELRRGGVAAAEVVGDGWVLAQGIPQEPAPVLAFATQVWPEPVEIRAESINAWAAAIFEVLREQLGDEPWRLHVFCHDVAGAEIRPRRAALIREALLELLKRKQRRLFRSLVAENGTLAEVALVSREHGYVSIVTPGKRAPWHHVLSPHLGGVIHPPEDKRPPARAYLKLREATLHLGRAPQAGETCVDLGAAPGSWTYDALAAGAHVTGIDRSPLRDDLMSHPNFTFIRGDAFKFAPDGPVDWLLCDVIAFPQRTIELLDTWLRNGWCRNFVVTLKFRGKEDYPQVDACKAVLRASGAQFAMRQLLNNKNEVTVYGSLAAK